jgi:hypothetical protein
MEAKSGVGLGQQLVTFRQEKEIQEYKEFYKKYFAGVRNRTMALTELAAISQKLSLKNPAIVTHFDKQYISLVAEGKQVLTKYFPAELVALYERDLPITKKKDQEFNNLLVALLAAFTTAFEELRQQNQRDFNYKKNLLSFIYNAYLTFGLHPSILKRDPALHKRFNLVVVHYLRSRKAVSEIKLLLTYEEFCNQFLTLYLDKKPVKFGGKLIPFDKIHEVTITTTLLMDDEIELFGFKNNFRWGSDYKDVESFVHCCLDETETYHPNPYHPATYSKEINLFLTAQAKEFLMAYPDAYKLYTQALYNFEKGIMERHVLDDLRLSLELLLKTILNNKKSLENQAPELGKYKKRNGSSPELMNMFQKILEYYAQYNNSYVKHNDQVNSGEVELMINLTTTFMKFIIK